MRIPPSVFVMSVVVAVPFGLAIKQTVKHEDPAGRIEEEEQAMRESAALQQAEYEKREAEDKAKAAAEKKQRDEKLMGLFGATPASMGPELKGFELGSVRTPGEVVALQESALGIEVQLDPTGQIFAISARLGTEFYNETGDNGCTIARERLETKWGPGKGGIWLDPATHRRVSIKDSGCEIRFERYVDVADWVKQLPFNYVGKKIEDVKESGNGSTWYLPGITAGDAATTVTVRVSAKDRVMGLSFVTTVPWDDRADVLAALTKKYGKPAVDLDVPDMYTWKSAQLSLSFTGTELEIVIGKLAEDQ